VVATQGAGETRKAVLGFKTGVSKVRVVQALSTALSPSFHPEAGPDQPPFPLRKGAHLQLHDLPSEALDGELVPRLPGAGLLALRLQRRLRRLHGAALLLVGELEEGTALHGGRVRGGAQLRLWTII